MSWRSWMAFAALGIIWGLPYFFVKLAVPELSPLIIAWGRVSLATLILLPIAWQRGALRSLGQHKWALCVFALVEFAIPFSAIALGERWISSSVTGMLIATVPLWVVVLGVVCTVLAMLLMFYLVTHAGASRASLITYINPVVATLLGVWLLREHLGFGAMTAFALILIGSWLASRTTARTVQASARAA